MRLLAFLGALFLLFIILRDATEIALKLGWLR